MNKPLIAFELKCVELPLDRLLPVRQIKDTSSKINRYKAILTSIREVGLVEPIVVHHDKKSDKYWIMDGHLRFYALKEIGVKSTQCLISLDDESFTYNSKINRIASIQEHRMIAKAISNGVPIERVASALNLSVKHLKEKMNLLDGLHPEVIDLLKEKPIGYEALKVIKRVQPVRQIEIAELMIASDDFSQPYAEALFMGTSKNQRVNPGGPKNRISPLQEIARLDQEMSGLEQEFKAIERTYSENMLDLTMIQGYFKRLQANASISRFMSVHHGDLLAELERLSLIDGL